MQRAARVQTMTSAAQRLVVMETSGPGPNQKRFADPYRLLESGPKSKLSHAQHMT